MATFYLRSTDGSDGDNGSTWALAFATLAYALSQMSAGDRLWVSESHAETQASAMTLTSPGTAASPCEILCGDDAAEPPTALATTATVTTTGSNAINFSAGFDYYYGVTFSGGDGAGSGATISFLAGQKRWQVFDSCKFIMPGTHTAVDLAMSSFGSSNDDQQIEFINTTVKFGNVEKGIRPALRFLWKNTASAIDAGGSAPTTLFESVASQPAQVFLHGVDLSALGAGKSLVEASAASPGHYRFENCKLGASVSFTAGTIIGQGGTIIEAVNCDSADTNYRYYYEDYRGTIQQESTIVRTGGASDGTTTISRKMVSSANTKLYSPLILNSVGILNETVGSSVTVTVHVVTDNITLQDDEAWLEIEYLGTSGTPLSLFASDRMSDILATPANQTTSTETWTTTGLSTPVKQQFAVSFTPQEKGVIRARIHLAKPSTTMYVCPKLEIS